MRPRIVVLAALAGPALLLAGAAPGGPAAAAAATHHPSVSIAASTPAIHLGATIAISGKVSPNRHGQPVALQRYYSRAWHQQRVATLSRSSHYTVTIKPTQTGVSKYRVHYAARSGWAAASSRTVSVKVTPAPPVTPRAASCYPLSNGGHCYQPGEYCRNTDHGVRGVAGDGKAIECEDNNGWRWEPV